MAQRSNPDPLKVFEPKDSHETVQGWALHATRRRKIHEQEARSLDRLRYALGATATCLAAAAGTSAFAAWQSSSTSTAAAVTTAVVGVGAAVLGSVVTFLDLGGRAEAHRRAASAYKQIMREFEAASGLRTAGDHSTSEQLVTKLMPLLAEADRNAPTVPARRGAEVEHEPFSFVATADELAPNPSRNAR